MSRTLSLFALTLACVQTISAQTPRVEFDVVSIKRSSPDAVGGGMRTLPDGTTIVTNHPIRSIFAAAPVSRTPVREVTGLPEWAERENYDITAKPPAGSTPQQRSEMWRTFFAERLRLIAHIEERESETFALVMASSDGRVGPQLKKSTLDCSPKPPGSIPPSPPPDFDPNSAMNRCGGLFGQGSIVSGGMTMDRLVPSLTGLAGRQVINRTGLAGDYAFTLTFSTRRTPGTSQDIAPDDAPDFFTALREQLGLKLQPEKTIVSVFVIDHIERPTEN